MYNTYDVGGEKMQDLNEENVQCCAKYEELDRPFNYGNFNNFGNKYPHNYGWNKYGPKWWYGGYNYPYGSYFPGTYYYGLPWFLLALKSLSPRDVIRYMDEMENTDF